MIALGVSALPFEDPAGFTAPAAFGPFRVLHQIGSGVLGPVFRTFDPQQEKLVAVKVFRLDVVPEISAHLAEVLKRMAAAPVKHPAVVGVLDAGLEGTTAFLAMEYVAAETLDVSLRRLAPASLETAVPMLRQVAEALEAGWAAGMGHGSLHPRDIFVMPPTAEPSHGHSVIRVSGFGIANALEELRIAAPVRRPYTAPERELAGWWDIRADVYSLGVIAHELLTGRRPTGASEPEQDAEWPADASPDQRHAIQQALAGALASDPEHRFETPMSFVDALMSEATPERRSDAPSLPWPVEVEAPMELESAGIEPDVEPGIEFADEDEEQVEEDRHVESSAAFADLPPVMEPAPVSAGVQRAERREPFQPFIETPRESAMPRYIGVAAIALALGTGFGYWLRGPAATDTPAVTSQTSVTKASPDEPIGTDVAVTPAPSPATTAAPAAAPASTRGRLLVRSVPGGATVSINGRGSGTTPATIRDLPFGTYTVAVSRSGYQRREQRVTLSKSAPAKELTVDLAAAPAAGRASVPGATTGVVLVETRPVGASVAIDGRAVGTAPVRVPELSPGSHTVRVTMAGRKTVTTTVVVRAGQVTPVRLSLEVQ